MQIKVSNRRAFETEVARLNKRAAKVGVAPIVFQFLKTTSIVQRSITICNDDGETSEQVREYPTDVALYELTLPSVGDYKWTLVATITSADGQVFVDTRIKGFDTTRFPNPCLCQHCNTNRHRNLTYVVQNIETQQMLQVGRNCFADYVGHDGLLKLEFQELLVSTFGSGEDDECFPRSGGGRGVEVVSVRRAIAAAEWLAQAQGGWRNNQKDQDGNITLEGTHRTGARYATAVGAGTDCWKELEDAAHPIWAQVDAIVEELKGLDLDDEFGQAVIYCLGFECVPAKKAGLVAYAGQFLRNHKERLVREAKKLTMVHVGVVGERNVFAGLKCIRVNSFDSQFGTTYIHSFEDANGNELVWKTGQNVADVGETITLKGTVKAHSEFRGAKQTELTRCKVMEAAAV